MPNREATKRETEDALGRNTVALIECGGKHDGLVAYYGDRDTKLMATGAVK